MNKINQLKKEERNKPLFLIIQKNLTTIKELTTSQKYYKPQIHSEIKPEIVFYSENETIILNLYEKLYKNEKYKLTYIMKCEQHIK